MNKSQNQFQSKYCDVFQSKMHYLEAGEGDPILFLHGNPTSSYLWRNIIPYMIPHGRCIAPDLIGMGKSDKPKLDYRFHDHYRFICRFIETMNLKNITLVIHDWGSALGFHYTAEHPKNIKAIAFMEAIVRPINWDGFPKEQKMGFKLFRAPIIGWIMISVLNMFVKVLLPQMIVRKLTAEEMAAYIEPFKNISSRKAVRQWPCEIPIDGSPRDIHDIVTDSGKFLQSSNIPKLLLHVDPGAATDATTVAWCKETFPNIETVKLGKGLHFIQEDHPKAIGEAISTWYKKITPNQ